MDDLEDNGYRYLRILELVNIFHREIKDHCVFETLHTFFKSYHNVRSFVTVINIEAVVVVVQHRVLILKLTRADINQFDRSTRKTMTMQFPLHQESEHAQALRVNVKVEVS